ncbi:MAG: YkvA family protein [Actinomycetota bacterium]
MSTTEMEPIGPGDRRQRLREIALLAPHLVKLVWRIARDPRVPARTKAILFVATGYLATPIDLIPDWFAGIGQADDLLVAAFALDQVLNRVPVDIVREHWEGDADILAVIQEVLDIASGFVPASIRKRLGGK